MIRHNSSVTRERKSYVYFPTVCKGDRPFRANFTRAEELSIQSFQVMETSHLGKSQKTDMICMSGSTSM